MELPPPPGIRRVSINPLEAPRRFSIFPGVMPIRSSLGSFLATAGTSKPSMQSSLRAPSLIPSPIPQKSSLSPADAMRRRASNVSSVHYANEQGKPPPLDEDKEKDKGKGKGKGKGTGTRLLNMLRKTLQGSDSEEMVIAQETPNLIPFGDVVGCLAVHIKTCRQFSHRFIIQQHVNMFIRVSINHIMKCTKLRNLKAVNNEKNLVLRFDEVKYFSVQVPRRQDDERNNIFLELMQDGGNIEKPPLSLGSVESHLYEVIQKGCFTEVLQMMHRHTFICRLEVEFMFSYGNFGYGFSHQLKPLQKIIEPSMFMKIAPPPERTDPVTNVITPQRVEYPAFLSPEFNVTVGSAEASQPSAAVRLEKLREKPRERFENMKKEYRNLNTWMEKAEYLKNLITPKVALQDSEEVSLIEVSEHNYSLLEEEHENVSHDIHYRKSDTISTESTDKSDKENLVIPALKLSDQDYSEPFLRKNSESVPEDNPLSPIHSLQIIEEDEVQHSHAPFVWEDKPQEERSVMLPLDEQLIPKPSSILRITSSLQEIKNKKEKFPHFSDVLTIPDKPLGQENTNQKGKTFIQLRKPWETRPTDIVSGLRKVAFTQKEYTTPVFRGESTEFKPKHQFQKFIKGGLDPFLRNINSKMSFKKKKDQDTYRYPSTLSTEVAEHEDQDPPYPEHSRSAGSNTTWANDSNLITIHMVTKKNNVPPDHTTTTTMTSDRKNKLPHDPTLNTTNTSHTKSIFTSDNPVITITKISESDYKLSTDPSSKTTKPSETRLSSGPSSNTTKPSETRLSSAPSSHTTKPSETRLSSAPSSHTTKPSETRLSSGPSSHTTKPSETRLSSGPSSHTTKPSETRLSSAPSSHTTKPSETRLSSGPSSHTTKPSETRLSSGPSSNTTKPSETRLSSGPSSHTTKPSETRLSSASSSNTTKPSETRLSSAPSSHTTKPSETRLSSGPSSHATKPSETRLSSGPSSNTMKPSEMRLSNGPSSHTTKPSENRLSSGPSSHTTKPSETRLSSGPSSRTTKPSETRLSSGPSSHTTKPSDTNRLSHNPSINGNKSSDPSKLSHDPSNISTKSSDPSKLSHDSSINARKSSDTNKLSHDASIISTKSLDSKNKLPSGKPNVSSDLTTNTAKTPATRDKLAWAPATVTVDSSTTQSKLEEQLPAVSLPNCPREPSVTGNVSIYHPSSTINFTSDIENLKQSIVLKSILSKNLQDLSDELFSTPEACTNAEEMQGSSPLPLGVHDRPSCGTEDRVFEQVQDINSWLSPKDILNSQALLSPVIKSVPQDLLPEGGPGTSSDIGDVSDKHLGAAEIPFPVNRKSSFKTKHLVSEVSGSDQGLNSDVRDYVIKQIFPAPIFSKLETGATVLNETQMALQDQLFTYWERTTSSQILTYEEKSNGAPLSRPKSGISTIIQSFPVETLLDSGIIKVIQLDKENQSSLLDIQTASPEEKLQNPTEQHHNVKSQTKLLSRQTTPSTKPIETSVNAADYTEDSQSTSAQEPNYPKAERKSDSPNEHQSPDTEEAGLSSAVESLSNLMGNLKDTDSVILKSILKTIFKNFFKYNQSERREYLDKQFDRLTQHSSPRGTEYLEKTQENFNKAGKAEKKPILDPKLSVFLEKLSESEVKNMKSELSKHIQHYLLEKLSEAGHITKEDLPQIYRNLYLMNEKTELKEQSSFQDKYSKTVEEIMSFVNNFNHHFIDKHLEIKLRSFLNEILQNYFVKNLSGSNLFNETDSVALRPSMSSMASNSSSKPLHGLGQDIASGSFGSRLKINMKYPFNESLQNYLKPLSENELLSLKADLSKYVQVLFIDKLHKSGLMTERQLKGISQQVNSLNSPPMPFKHINTDSPFRDESCFMREDSEEQKKYPKTCQNTTFRTLLEDRCGETELTRKGEKGSSFPHNLKENPSTTWEHKRVYSREVKTLMKVQPPSNKNIQAIPLSKSPERPADILLKKHKQDHGFMPLPQAENSIYKTETQEPYSWDGRAKPIQSKLCFEKTLKVKALEKRDNNNICKLAVQERPDPGFSPYLKLPTCKTARENEHLNRLSFPTWRANTFIYVNTDNGEQSKLDQYCQRWKENNNNNKKHLVTFAQFKNEMETLYINPYEDCKEKCARGAESQSFRYKEEERNSRPSFFPEVLTRENMKSKRKERDYTTKPKKSFHKIVRILPAALPTARPHLRKSVPRTLLHWTARRTIHDCLDRFDDLQIPSVKRPKNSKSRSRLLGKSPDDSYNQAKHCTRPSTAPESNKRRESVTGKFASPRMVSAGLVHIHDTTPEYDIRKVRSKRKLKENIEKRPLIYDIIQMLDTAE
ncbi:cation channel sperm-associated targeting subunit tau [Peromyscus californicus insignis]|uniref:cation channel sperm-associated targeting subunit tau n=1 Tax=Peromyscus californicus insignis TaxID=564181 RepID=UPI0022A67E7D|nr:cation channel sperm-associated targeting subunit tau [Peromyscus californicus insignis]